MDAAHIHGWVDMAVEKRSLDRQPQHCAVRSQLEKFEFTGEKFDSKIKPPFLDLNTNSDKRNNGEWRFAKRTHNLMCVCCPMAKLARRLFCLPFEEGMFVDWLWPPVSDLQFTVLDFGEPERTSL